MMILLLLGYRALKHYSQTLPKAHDDLSVVDLDTVADAPSSVMSVSGSSCDLVVTGVSSNRYTSRLGRVVRPVRRLIMSMVQFESVLGRELRSPVIDV